MIDREGADVSDFTESHASVEADTRERNYRVAVVFRLPYEDGAALARALQQRFARP